MIAILTATKTEAQHLLRTMSPVKQEGIFHYRGKLGNKPAALYLTRAGVASREQLRRFLRLYQTDLVIATGACGSLTSELAPLQSVQICAVTNHEKRWINISRTGRKCVSVRHLVTDDAAKASLRTLTQADLLDMETWTIASVMQEKEFSARHFAAVRVVDDLPGESRYLEKEKLLRDLTARTPSGRPRFQDIVRLGVWDYFLIALRRYRVSAAILRAVRQTAGA